jgi:hypothetical protein
MRQWLTIERQSTVVKAGVFRKTVVWYPIWKGFAMPGGGTGGINIGDDKPGTARQATWSSVEEAKLPPNWVA